MKRINKLKLLAVMFVATAAVLSAANTIVAGPKGGRLLETKPLRAEFFVTADRQVEVTFYDAALKPVAPGAQIVSVTAEPKSGRTTLGMEKNTTGFVSKTPLPKSDTPYRVVVQVRPSAETPPQNFRIDLNLETCGECKYAEYACTCGH